METIEQTIARGYRGIKQTRADWLKTFAHDIAIMQRTGRLTEARTLNAYRFMYAARIIGEGC